MTRPRSTLHLVLPLLLSALTVACYWPVRHHEFVNYDDTGYITDNEIVQQGLTLAGLKWAFTTDAMSNWHPLTWLSHMLDCELFGVNAGAHLLMNVLLHAMTAAVMWLVLARLTGSWWRSGFVAAVFALHPLNVESVAWVSERKNILSTFFMLLAINSYQTYVLSRSAKRYLLVILWMALSLMCKPMMVTLPAVLLLLDFWPLRRFGTSLSFDQSLWHALRPALLDKIPLLLLSIGSSIITVIVQSRGGAMSTLEQVPLVTRTANAIIAYGWYAWKLAWPTDLCVLYPLPAYVSIPAAAAIGTLLLSGLAVALLFRRAWPHLLVGLLWYLGTLVPVIGIVQVGSQSTADRYAYVPMIGLLILVAWSLPTASPVGRRTTIGMYATALAGMITAMFLATRNQISFWRDNSTLFQRALAVDSSNHLAHVHVGVALEDDDQLLPAMAHYVKAVELRPDSARAKVFLGNAMMKAGRLQESIALYRAALTIDPTSGETQHNLASALLAVGDAAGAAREFEKAVRLLPHSFDIHYNYGNALFALNRYSEAAEHFRLAIAIDPLAASAHNNLGATMGAQGKFQQAIEHFQRARELDPAFPGLAFNLASAYEATNELHRAVELYQDALRENPDDALACMRLARLHEQAGRHNDALEYYKRALQLQPGIEEAEIAIMRLQQS